MRINKRSMSTINENLFIKFRSLWYNESLGCYNESQSGGSTQSGYGQPPIFNIWILTQSHYSIPPHLSTWN